MDKDILEILTLDNAISVDKDNKTHVDYFIFDEFEIHFNMIPPNSVQEWHYHQNIEETICVISGQMECSWLENHKINTKTIYPKQIVRVKQSTHTFSNQNNKACEFIVFRFVPDKKSKKEIIKNDKTIMEVNNEL